MGFDRQKLHVVERCSSAELRLLLITPISAASISLDATEVHTGEPNQKHERLYEPRDVEPTYYLCYTNGIANDPWL